MWLRHPPFSLEYDASPPKCACVCVGAASYLFACARTHTQMHINNNTDTAAAAVAIAIIDDIINWQPYASSCDTINHRYIIIGDTGMFLYKYAIIFESSPLPSYIFICLCPAWDEGSTYARLYFVVRYTLICDAWHCLFSCSITILINACRPYWSKQAYVCLHVFCLCVYMYASFSCDLRVINLGKETKEKSFAQAAAATTNIQFNYTLD